MRKYTVLTCYFISLSIGFWGIFQYNLGIERGVNVPKLGKADGIVKPLSDRQAMAARLIATGFKKTDVAAQLNLTVDTVYLWNKNPLFRVTIANERDAILNETLSLARSASYEAVKTLTSVMQDAKECGAVKTNAASVLLRYQTSFDLLGKHYAPLSSESSKAEREYQKYAEEKAKEAEHSKWLELAHYIGGYEADQLVNDWKQNGYRDWDWEKMIADVLADREETKQTKIDELTPRLGEENALKLVQNWEADVLSMRPFSYWDWEREVAKVEQTLPNHKTYSSHTLANLEAKKLMQSEILNIVDSETLRQAKELLEKAGNHNDEEAEHTLGKQDDNFTPTASDEEEDKIQSLEETGEMNEGIIPKAEKDDDLVIFGEEDDAED
jgi:predicted peroxiredoxin